MPHLGHQYYEEHGSGEPLVLLHGYTLDHRIWAHLLPRLTPRHRVILPDLQGHGQSGVSPEGAALADDLAALLRHLGLERAAVCGLSMGGGVAISFALHYPQMCAALIPVAPAIFGYRYTKWRTARPYILQARKEGLAAALEAWLADPLFATLPEGPVAERLRSIVRAFPSTLWLQKTPSPVPPGPPEVDRLHEITAPTLALVGERDLPDFRRMAELVAERVEGARLEVVPGAGHLLPLEQPERFAEAMLAFLSNQSGV